MTGNLIAGEKCFPPVKRAPQLTHTFSKPPPFPKETFCPSESTSQTTMPPPSRVKIPDCQIQTTHSRSLVGYKPFVPITNEPFVPKTNVTSSPTLVSMPNSAQMTDPQQVSLNGAFGRKKPDLSRKVWTWINCFAPDNPKIRFEPKDGTNWTFIDESIRDQGDRRRGRIRT